MYESIYASLAEASSLAEDLPSPPKVCTDTSIVQNSSSSANSVWNNGQQSAFACQVYKTSKHFSLDFGENIQTKLF